MALRTILCMLLAALVTSGAAWAQAVPAAAPTTSVAVQSLPDMSVKFDPQRATNAYLAQVSGPARGGANKYYASGYLLWVLCVFSLFPLSRSFFLFSVRIVALAAYRGGDTRLGREPDPIA